MTTSKSITDYLDALIDEQEGFRTEVTVSLPSEMLWKLVGVLLGTGISILVVAHLVKNAFPNKQLKQNNTLLLDIKALLEVRR